MEGINLQRFVTGLTDNLEAPVRHHLKNVYSTVTIAALCASAGGYCHLYSSFIGAGMMTFLGAIFSLLALMAIPHNGKNQAQRLSILAAFGFMSGCNLGPLLEIAIIVNPALIMEALLGTAVVFACFSLSALYAPRGQYLYLGGTLMSVLSTLCVLSIVNIFIGSTLLFKAHLYISLAVMCGFIVYDTQLIIEKRRLGNTDYILHGLELFIDFMAVFRKILVILTDKEAQQKRKRKN